MGSILDILGGMIIGSVLLLVAATALDRGTRQFVNLNADAIVQDELAELTRIVQSDLRKMGYGIPEAMQSNIIQIAQPTQLKYLSNLDTDTNPDTILYTIAPFDTINFIDTSVVLFGINRSVSMTSGSNESGMVGVIANNSVFRYLDQIGNPVAIITATKMVEVSLVALNPNVYMSDEAIQATTPAERMVEIRKLIRESYWRQTRVISKNLRR